MKGNHRESRSPGPHWPFAGEAVCDLHSNFSARMGTFEFPISWKLVYFIWDVGYHSPHLMSFLLGGLGSPFVCRRFDGIVWDNVFVLSTWQGVSDLRWISRFRGQMLGCQYSTVIAYTSQFEHYYSLFHMCVNDGSHQFPKSSQKMTFDSERHVLQLEMKMDELPAFKKPLMLSITNCIAMLQVHVNTCLDFCWNCMKVIWTVHLDVKQFPGFMYSSWHFMIFPCYSH